MGHFYRFKNDHLDFGSYFFSYIAVSSTTQQAVAWEPRPRHFFFAELLLRLLLRFHLREKITTAEAIEIA